MDTSIPQRVSYIVEIATKYGSELLLTTDGTVQFLKTFKQADIDLLTDVYWRIRDNDDVGPLTDWLVDAPDHEKDKPPYRNVRLLFKLFDVLSRMEVPPFTRCLSLHVSSSRKPNWDRLPPRFAYLIEPANKLGDLRDPMQIESFAHLMSPQERSELQALGQRIVQEMDEIDAWINRHSLCEYPESAALHFMLSALGELGFLD